MDTTLSKTEMEATVNSALEAITDQLFVNAEKICTYNYEKWGN